MISIIFTTAVRVLMPLLLLFSLFLMLRGHNEPGGGFGGGLVAAAAFALYSFAFQSDAARRVLRSQPPTLIAVGLIMALGSGLIGLGNGLPFLTGIWEQITLPGGNQAYIGTPIIFDLGVYLVVIGVILMIVFALQEAE